MQRKERRQQHPLRQIAGGTEEQSVSAVGAIGSYRSSKAEPLDSADDAGSDRDRQSELNDADALWRSHGNNAPRGNSLL